MNYKAHIAFGIFFLIGLFFLDKFYLHFFNLDFNWLLLGLYAPLIIFSFLLPDIDCPSSKPRFIITTLFLAMIVYFAFTSSILYVIILAVILFLIWIMNFIKGWEHRGHAHSILFILIVSLLVIIVSWKIAIIFFFGALSHLIADTCIKVW